MNCSPYGRLHSAPPAVLTTARVPTSCPVSCSSCPQLLGTARFRGPLHPFNKLLHASPPFHQLPCELLQLSLQTARSASLVGCSTRPQLLAWPALHSTIGISAACNIQELFDTGTPFSQ
uniref:Uncharacterized protein n=1 Tax=Chelonoidis abingdonii TaxID=106734 RepID=A0A8C0IYL5_CHEAB